ncbi:putative F-box protein [Cardamine amara subsp. amara]|uniref:F-box protein n=1 Tax=Cardamine amara subsp. amara TaxID=228776 RepID=A0ABD1AUK0_CARAN
MSTMSNLSRDLVEMILSRLPITSLREVRSTCKRWNDLIKDPKFIKKHYGQEAKEILMIMIYDSRACLMSLNLHGNHKDLVDPSIKQIGKLDQVKIINVFHCNGFLLCVTKNHSRVMVLVWNPYLGQTKWIQLRNDYHILDSFAMGFDSNNNNHKILRFSYSFNQKYEIYNFQSNSWRVLDIINNWSIYRGDVTLKGNTYFIAKEKLKVEEFLICFDFTSERFGPFLPLSFHPRPEDYVLLSAVREDKLAVLFKKHDAYEMEIWITTQIEPNTVSWSSFLKFDVRFLNESFLFPYASFFVEENKKVALIYAIDRASGTNQKAYIVGENGYYREVALRDSKCWILMCSYVPSSVQIE